MKYFGNGLSEVHKELNKIIHKEEKIEQAKELFLKIHAKLHLSKISNTEKNEVDKLINDLNRDEYAIMPTNKDETIAWVLWHITRIEDLTVNMLVAQKEQIFNEQWKDRLSVFITDTGNALSDDEIMNLSKSINIDELLCYRNEVAKNTIEVVKDLKAEDMKRKVSPIDLERILVTGGVIKHEDSIWLLDFWGNKDIAGILLMPPTRHVILHLNDCCKWKEYFRTKKKFYRS
ncbi:TPA: DinB family protein [Clostridioides difficile]|nr:DinB family protein [Clostridioides difficile]SJP12344.1 DinB superfamily [Clostridioides difficile]HBF4440547.1 DinB family protein [Clostridioides difficile]HBF4444606.1 DinB family protein [Clostridioides difficile]HBF5454256.1 DinB family protein [Clostridioides difficile]